MEIVTMVLVLGLALIPLVIPLFRPPLLALRSASGPAARLQALELRKAAIYGAIREVGFDLRTDKVEQGDYDQQMASLKREAVEVVGEIEKLKNSPPRGSKKVERAVAAVRKGTSPRKEKAAREERPATAQDTEAAARFCTQCGHAAADDDRFCARCGTGLQATE